MSCASGSAPRRSRRRGGRSASTWRWRPTRPRRRAGWRPWRSWRRCSGPASRSPRWRRPRSSRRWPRRRRRSCSAPTSCVPSPCWPTSPRGRVARCWRRAAVGPTSPRLRRSPRASIRRAGWRGRSVRPSTPPARLATPPRRSWRGCARSARGWRRTRGARSSGSCARRSTRRCCRTSSSRSAPSGSCCRSRRAPSRSAWASCTTPRGPARRCSSSRPPWSPPTTASRWPSSTSGASRAAFSKLSPPTSRWRRTRCAASAAVLAALDALAASARLGLGYGGDRDRDRRGARSSTSARRATRCWRWPTPPERAQSWPTTSRWAAPRRASSS